MALPPRSGPDQPGDRLGRLADLRVRHLAPLGGRLGHAMAEMVLHQAERHRLQRPGRRRYLGQDVDAVLVFLNHLLQAADLALDAAKPHEVGLLVRGVPVALAAGAVTFISPCCLPLVPGYLSYVAGMSGAEAQRSADPLAPPGGTSPSVAGAAAGPGAVAVVASPPAVRSGSAMR